MEPTTSAWQAFIDFWLSLVKFLGRPAVQVQMAAAIVAVLVAWLVARWIVAALEKAIQKQRGARLHFTLFVVQLVFPVLAILVLYGVYVYFVGQRWYSGLLADVIYLYGFFFLYRLAMGLGYAFGSQERVRYYQQRLFGPLFAVSTLLLVINVVTEIDTLASARLLKLDQGYLTPRTLLAASFGFYLWIMTINLVKDLIRAYVGRYTKVNPGSLNAVLTLFQYGLVALGLFAVFRILQLNTATIAAITGGLSIGIGIALQDVLKNFLGGIIVLFEGGVRPGDVVEVGGTEGEVVQMNIRSTTVRIGDNVEYIVPNQTWLNSTVKTFTRTSRRARVRLPIGIKGAADPLAVRQLLFDTAQAQPSVLQSPPVVVAVADIDTGGAEFVVLAWVDDIKSKGKVTEELRLKLWDALTAQGIAYT